MDPSKETDLKKLTAEDQALIRRTLGGDTSTPYDGCLNQECLDEETTWLVPKRKLPDAPVSRCSRCNHPKAFHRTVNGVRDILRPTFDREKVDRHSLLGIPW